MSTLTSTAYIPTPISETPPKDGFYDCYNSKLSNTKYRYEFDSKRSSGYEWGWQRIGKEMTHYLKPVDLSKMLEEAWEAGEERERWLHTSDYPKPVDKYDYINNVLNPSK